MSILLNQTCTVNTYSSSQSSNGYPQAAYTTGTKSLPCSLQPASSREGIIYDKETGETMLELLFADNYTDGTAATILQGDRVVCSGVTYEVKGHAMRDVGLTISINYVNVARLA